MLADDLRHAMKTSGLSTYAIARLIGVDPKTVKGFADGGGLNIATASAICEVLGVGLAKQGELAQNPPTTKNKSSKQRPRWPSPYTSRWVGNDLTPSWRL
jgi:hypothetical protein